MTTRINSQVVSDGQYASAGRFFGEIDEMYRKQFAAEDFTIIWIGEPENSKKLAAWTKIKIMDFQSWTSEAFSDGHKKPEGIKILSDFLFDSKIIP